ncbi:MULTISPECIES: FAD-dependent monooxygenase [Amycolatopsis]|uniref:FAD-dependent monooxygenase n=1 Tax=Amycolatopsis dendrobii TaxID=2760662 RepID=A0A7W3W367_9PSEU|nr:MULTISPECIES: FAD-dependent monooxygenase [Amycolatopsis]MBB1158041.1 FAD-dependent monooxygenase [Amycolatopsis dendrobii]UKD57165.1 FAD-dependent monooxygenase [Amycolatopsis sp. FU40]
MAGKALSVAIAGGGIGGLTLALALRQRGIGAEVYERSAELREVGAAVALAANGSRVLARLGLRDELAACSAVPTELVYRHWRSGQRVVAHPIGDAYEERFAGPYFGIHRADLQRILAGAWGKVHLGRQVTGVVADGARYRLAFADGTSETADVVVGADGVHSAVRSWVDDAPLARYSGSSGFRGLVPAERLPSLPDAGAIQFWMGPGGHLLHYAIGDGSVVNFLAVLDEPDVWTGESWTEDIPRERIEAAFEGWHPAVRETVGATTLYQRWGLFGQHPLNRWHRGGVVLLGDAAHAMLPHHGQGANQTIEDAVTLAECLARDSREAALARYEKLRRPRTRAVQRSSWVANALLHLPDGPAAEARDAALGRIGETLEWIHSHDALTAAERG